MPTAVTTRDAAEALYDANVVEDTQEFQEEFGKITRYEETEEGLVRMGHNGTKATYDIKIEDFEELLTR